jgi:hypothetical protein
MEKNYFTDEQIMLMKLNPYTKKVSKSTLKFTEEFKSLFWNDYKNSSLSKRSIFKKYGYDPEVLGTKRMDGFVYMLRKEFLSDEERSLNITPKKERPLLKTDYSKMEPNEAIRLMETEMKFLRQEVEFLKKISSEVLRKK